MRARRTLVPTIPALILCALPLLSGEPTATPVGEDSAAGRAPSAASSTETSAEEAYEKLLARLAAAHTLCYDGIYRFEGKDRALVVNMTFERTEFVPRFRIGTTRQVSAHDGKTFGTWKFEEGELVSGDGDRAWLFRDMNLLLEPFLLDGGEKAMNLLAKGERDQRWGAERDLDGTGVLCRELVVESRPEPAAFRASIWITPDDLPRRWVLQGSDGTLKRSAEYYNLKLDAEVPEATFHLDPPEGIERKSYEAVIGQLMEAAAEKGMPEQLIAVGTQMSDWELKAPGGETRRLSEHRGKVVMLDFWATWCGPCKMAMPSVQKIHEEYEDRGVVVYGVNVFEHDEAKAIEYLKDRGYTYGLLLGGDAVAKELGIQGIPAFVVIDREGRAAFSATGATNELWVRKTLDRLLAEPPGEGGGTGGGE